MISSILIFALENNLCDVVLHIGLEESNPFAIKLYASYSRNDVISHVASRYISGLTYKDLKNFIQRGKNTQL